MRVSWKDIKESTEFLSYLSVIAGIAIAVAAYYSEAAKGRVETAVEHLKEFQSVDIRAARKSIEYPWRNYDVQRLNDTEGNLAAIKQLASAMVANDTVESSLIEVVEYIDSVGSCIELGLCERSIVTEQLGSYTSTLMCLYYPEIERIRAKRLFPGFGTKLGFVGSGDDC